MLTQKVALQTPVVARLSCQFGARNENVRPIRSQVALNTSTVFDRCDFLQ